MPDTHWPPDTRRVRAPLLGRCQGLCGIRSPPFSQPAPPLLCSGALPALPPAFVHSHGQRSFSCISVWACAPWPGLIVTCCFPLDTFHTIHKAVVIKCPLWVWLSQVQVLVLPFISHLSATLYAIIKASPHRIIAKIQ